MRGNRHQLRRPEDVGVDQAQRQQQPCDDASRAAHAAHLGGPQRQPHGQKSLERDGNDEPGGAGQRQVREEDEELAGGRRHVQELLSPNHPNPSLEGRRQQHGGVGHG